MSFFDVCAAYYRIEINFHAGILSHIGKRKREYSGRKLAVQPPLFFGIVVLPAIFNRSPACFHCKAKHFVRHAEYYLFASSVTHWHEIIYKPVGCKSAQRQSFFDEQRFFTGARRSGNSRHASAAYDYLPFSFLFYSFGCFDIHFRSFFDLFSLCRKNRTLLRFRAIFRLYLYPLRQPFRFHLQAFPQAAFRLNS